MGSVLVISILPLVKTVSEMWTARTLPKTISTFDEALVEYTRSKGRAKQEGKSDRGRAGERGESVCAYSSHGWVAR